MIDWVIESGFMYVFMWVGVIFGKCYGCCCLFVDGFDGGGFGFDGVIERLFLLSCMFSLVLLILLCSVIFCLFLICNLVLLLSGMLRLVGSLMGVFLGVVIGVGWVFGIVLFMKLC